MAYKPSYKSKRSSKRRFKKSVKKRSMKKIPSQTHYFKRLGQTIILGDAGGANLNYLRLYSGG